MNDVVARMCIRDNSKAFYDMVTRIGDYELKDYTVNWKGNVTGFTLEQIASMLYPDRLLLLEAITFKLFVLDLLFFAFQVVCAFALLEFSSINSAVVIAGTGVTLSLTGYVMRRIGKYAKHTILNTGRAAMQFAELMRFVDALQQALQHLDLPIDALDLNGRKKVLQLADDRLLAFVLKILEKEDGGENASAERDILRERFDALDLLGLTSRGYSDLFRKAYAIQSRPAAA